jgi:ATP-binding cassette subfamily C protein
MLKAVRASLGFMARKEKSRWLFLVFIKALLSILDLVGVLAIGFIVTSTAIFLSAGSDPERVLEFAGVQIPAVNAQTLPWVSAGVLSLFLTKAAFSILLTRLAALLVASVEARAAKCIAETAFSGDLSDARRRSREEIMFAVQGGAPSAFTGLLNAANVLVSEATLFLVVCIGFVFVDPLATFASVIYFGIVALVIQFFVGSLLGRAGEIAAEGSIKANVAISDLLAVFRELLVLNRRDIYIERLFEARKRAADSAAQQYYLSGMPRYIIEAALLIGVALFVLAQALTGDIVKSAGTIGVFLAGGFRLTAALLPLQSSLLTIKSVIPPANKAYEVLSESMTVTSINKPNGVMNDFKNTVESITQPLGIKFEKVSFAYPGSDILTIKELSFVIKPGSQIALMGPSGAGKSTIADLICDVLNPKSGSITRYSILERNINPARGQRVSYVPQRPGLVSGTIRDNVALGINPQDVDPVRVEESLRLAHLDTLIKGLPQGVDTSLGNLQDGLSGGQIQRLGLARALYSKPGLLVMDEATSALDSESELEIQKALEEMRGKVTVVLIAHRLNTIQHADRVLLIQEGELKDSGSFKELILRNPSVEKVVDLLKVDKS